MRRPPASLRAPTARIPSGRWWIAPAVALAWVLSWAAPARAAPDVELSLGALAGHDDEVLADPGGSGVLEPLSSPYRTLSARLRTAWGIGRSDRLDATAQAAGTRYADGLSGWDTDLRGSLGWTRWAGAAVRIGLEASGLRFRRDEVPLFDLDQGSAEGRIDWTVEDTWILGSRLVLARTGYPGRTLRADSSLAPSEQRTQRDTGLALSLAALHAFSRRIEAGIEAGWQTLDSNDPLADTRGPFVLLLGEWRGGRSALDGSVELAARRYPDYPVLTAVSGPMGSGTAPEARSDRTWRFALSAEHRVRDPFRLFAGIIHTRQRSNVDALEYDQTRIDAGFRLVLGDAPGLPASGTAWTDEVLRRAATEEPPYAPSPIEGGIRFRIHAPDAHAVSVVGGWNAWNAERAPLSGPDASGDWSADVPIGPGTWRYAFIVDETWVRPPDAFRYEDDGFGGENGILVVGP